MNDTRRYQRYESVASRHDAYSDAIHAKMQCLAYLGFAAAHYREFTFRCIPLVSVIPSLPKSHSPFL